MSKTRTWIALVVLGFAAGMPGSAHACCADLTVHLVWPYDGLEQVPLDSFILAYHQAETPLEETRASLPNCTS